MIDIFIPGSPPRTTFQAKKIAVRNGKAFIYDSEEAKVAKEYLFLTTRKYRPKTPITSPVSLEIEFAFQAKSQKPGRWKTTKPDADNLVKALSDVLTKNGYWQDDAQISCLKVEKYWSDNPGIRIKITELDRERKEE